MKHLLLVLSFLSIMFNTYAQVKLVKDIYPGPSPRNSDPQFLTGFGLKLYFSALDTGIGRELYSYDGTNVSLVDDLNPGIGDGCMGSGGDYENKYTVVGSKMYFAGNDGTHGDELFVYDGLTTPTMVADINPGTANSSPSCLMSYSGKVYLIGYDALYHYQLFVFDPASGIATRKSSLTNGLLAFESMTAYRGKIYFTGNDGITGDEFYVYDPVTGISSMVADIRPGAQSSEPDNYIVGNDTLYFSASTSSGPMQVFKYTGSDTPVCITSLVPGFNGFKGHLAFFKNMLVFSADNGDGKGVELYKYDIATKTTSQVYDINPGSNSSNPNGFVVYGSKIYFAANDGTHGTELWAWNGTANPYLFADIDSGGPTSSSFPKALTVWNGVLYMNATNTAVGTELFKYTDTTLGIVNVMAGIDIKVYPVPTSSITNVEINVKNDTRMSLMVSDINGKRIYTSEMQDYNTGQHTIPLDMRNWPTGSYYYRLTDNLGKMIAAGRLVKLE